MRMTRAANAEALLEQTPYEMIGGEAALRRIVNRFYDIMDTDAGAATIRAMHAADLTPMRERRFEFLSGWLGGPPLYFQRPGHKCIGSAHGPYAIGENERDEWLMCMRRAMTDCGVKSEIRELLDRPFRTIADAFRNR